MKVQYKSMLSGILRGSIITGLLVSAGGLATFAQTWKPVEGKIMSEWAAKVDPAKTLPDYPRPQLQRENWQNLNGLWDYAITLKAAAQPKKFDGKILVPFAVESALSGVGKTVGKDSVLWYKAVFSPKKLQKKTLLHFGASDWRTEIWINGKKAGSHEGGFDPFSLDVSAFLKGGKNEMIVRIWDPTDQGPQPRGKQVKNPEGIWYTPVTGIWQTVWLESVPETYIASTKQTPDIDKKTLMISADVKNAKAGDLLKVTVLDGGKKVTEKAFDAKNTGEISISDPKLWSPDQPFLYDLNVEVVRGGKTVDAAKSYFAMRKSSIGPDANGILRMLLNNEFVFQYGPLDQGWWPDGLYTAPTDEALKFDIQKTKDMGFNMIRKHIKVEPARWYYYCDKLGMLVWQDMPSGDLGNHWENRPGVVENATDQKRSPESEGYYRKEWTAIMDALHNYPCIVTWVPFNEAWGQFKTTEITEWTMKKDPSRIVNSASGGNYELTGHLIDLHNYPAPAMPRPEIFGAKQAIVLGEFGGLGLPVENHLWWNKRNWGYQSFKSADSMFVKYETFTKRLAEFIPKGLSAAVYTQTTDVEGEINGFLTYDRKVMKMPEEKLKAANTALYNKEWVKLK